MQDKYNHLEIEQAARELLCAVARCGQHARWRRARCIQQRQHQPLAIEYHQEVAGAVH